MIHSAGERAYDTIVQKRYLFGNSTASENDRVELKQVVEMLRAKLRLVA